MSSKVFIGFILVAIVGIFGFAVFKQKSKPAAPRLGTEHPSQGQNHIAQGQKHDAYNSSPASSGPHYADSSAPTSWGVYTQQVPEEVFLHNEEHGGVIITYKPDLPADQVKKLQLLFAPPYSNAKFSPSKAIVTPRSKNTKPIELASWRRTLSLDSYDENTIMQYYLTNIGKSPEAGAGPSNTPINQVQ